MDLDLKSKTAVVSGACIGIGRAIAKGLALEGVRVVGVARRKDLLDQLAQEVKAAGGTLDPGDAGHHGRKTPRRSWRPPRSPNWAMSTSSSTTPAAAGRCRWTRPTAPGTKRLSLNFTRYRQVTHALLAADDANANGDASSTSPASPNRRD